MKLATLLLASSAALFACGETTTTTVPAGGSPGGGGEQDKGLEGDGVAAANSAPDTNPDGVKYPTANIGTSKGSIIKNYKFVGYPDANVSAGLKPISLAQFYDPTGEKYKVIHIQAAGVWCSACRAETKALIPVQEQLVKMKAVWIVSLAEGPKGGDPSTKKDLDGWIQEFSSPYTHVLDPNNKNLGPFYDRSALPWNANIDAKTMKILTSGTGAITTEEGIVDEIKEALKAVDAQ